MSHGGGSASYFSSVGGNLMRLLFFSIRSVCFYKSHIYIPFSFFFVVGLYGEFHILTRCFFYFFYDERTCYTLAVAVPVQTSHDC